MMDTRNPPRVYSSSRHLDGQKSANEEKIRKYRQKEEEAASERYLQGYIKHCPACSTAIHKPDGCSRVFCMSSVLPSSYLLWKFTCSNKLYIFSDYYCLGGCGQAFCYRCEGKWGREKTNYKGAEHLPTCKLHQDYFSTRKGRREMKMQEKDPRLRWRWLCFH